MHPHLTDETLNEYLDEALPAAQAAGVAAHVSACVTCAARLRARRALFAELDGLPEAPIAHSLTPGVLAALPRQAAMRNSAHGRRPALRWLALAEVAAALALLALAWPIIGALLAEAPTLAAEWLARLPTLTTIDWLAAAQGWLAALKPPAPSNWLPIGLGPLTLGLAVAAAAAVWLVGNAVMLRRSVSLRPRRNV
ncbi:MAG: hypothetical protein IT317_19330 [Anaerolineales bacterium]|nr:hypothetical protein [Anaerolineales bacterium]